MATIHGRNAHVYLQGSGSEAIPVSESNEWTMNLEFDTEVDAAFGDTWESTLRGLVRASGTIGGNFDTAATVLWDATINSNPRKMYLYPDRASTARYYYGTIWPQLSANMPMGVGKTTVNWRNAGEIAFN